jgi:hypothetical protein
MNMWKGMKVNGMLFIFAWLCSVSHTESSRQSQQHRYRFFVRGNNGSIRYLWLDDQGHLLEPPENQLRLHPRIEVTTQETPTDAMLVAPPSSRPTSPQNWAFPRLPRVIIQMTQPPSRPESPQNQSTLTGPAGDPQPAQKILPPPRTEFMSSSELNSDPGAEFMFFSELDSDEDQ